MSTNKLNNIHQYNIGDTIVVQQEDPSYNDFKRGDKIKITEIDTKNSYTKAPICGYKKGDSHQDSYWISISQIPLLSNKPTNQKTITKAIILSIVKEALLEYTIDDDITNSIDVLAKRVINNHLSQL